MPLPVGHYTVREKWVAEAQAELELSALSGAGVASIGARRQSFGACLPNQTTDSIDHDDCTPPIHDQRTFTNILDNPDLYRD